MTDAPFFFVAPTERGVIKALASGEGGGEVSMFPERMGCDVAWRAHGGWWGCQRKELKDFIASIADGRLAKEIAQMKALPHPSIVIEGRIKWDNDGCLIAQGYGSGSRRITRSQWRGMIWSIERQGIHVAYTTDMTDTAEWIKHFAQWSMKDKHYSAIRRPGPVSAWGSVSNEDYALHLLQGFDGVGVDKAKAIVDHFGGVPLQWTCTEKELMQVEGVGKVIAKRMVKALEMVEK